MVIRRRISLVATAVCALMLGACGSAASSRPPVSSAPPASAAWVDQPVTFKSGGMTIYGTFRHPTNDHHLVPGVLLIAGSGPTDQNGNSPLESGPVDTLKQLADWLSEDGVASLRYDKLGSGETGLGPYASNPSTIGVPVFETEAVDALKFLAVQAGVNTKELAVFGHSEGGLFALLLASGAAGPTPPIHAVGLFEPLSERYLTIISIQLLGQVEAQEKAGEISPALAGRVRSVLATTIDSLRRTGHVASSLPYGIGSVLNPSDALFLSQADKYDPGVLAAALKPGTPVLLTCSNADIQVTCGEADQVYAGLRKGHADADFVHLVGVDHVLKVDSSMTAANYTKPLPFSPQLASDLKSFVARYL